MPRRIPEEEYQRILGIIGRYPEGVAIRDLMAVPELDYPKRTLQRRLDDLVQSGRIVPRGEGRARVYLLAAEPVEAKVRETDDGRDWLSAEASLLHDAVHQPIFKRSPVGYRREFMDAYVPNETFYLPESTRRELLELGHVGLTKLPAGTYLRQILHRLLIDLSWNSSRLEGNTYSLLDTKKLLELGESAAGKDAQETQMILNHKEAIEFLADQPGEIGFNRYTILNLHALLSDNLLADPAAGGRLRQRAVVIGGSVFHPLEVPQLIEERFNLLLEKAAAISDPFELAFFVMVHLPYLQPFEDVNKRVSRLAANIPLMQENLCPLSFIDVPADDYLTGILAIYELNRPEYLRDLFVWAYRRSGERYSAVRESLGDPDPFRLRHREEVKRAVLVIVKSDLDEHETREVLASIAEKDVPKEDRARFVEVVESELVGLHEGNLARYRLRPSQFRSWKQS